MSGSPRPAGPGSDDICYATTNRQRAVRAIAAESDLVLVAGSANSSNSLRLVETAQRAGTPAYLIDGARGHRARLAGRGRRIVGDHRGRVGAPAVVGQIIEALSGLGVSRGHRAASVATESIRVRRFPRS